MKQERRTRKLVDGLQMHVQIRVALYCVLYLLALFVVLAFWENFARAIEMATGVPFAAYDWLPALFVFAILAFIVVRDCLNFTHRIFGPIYRFRKTLEAVRSGEPVRLIQLRKGDYLLEFKDEINETLQYLAEQGAINLQTQKVAEQAPAETTTTTEAIQPAP